MEPIAQEEISQDINNYIADNDRDPEVGDIVQVIGANGNTIPIGTITQIIGFEERNAFAIMAYPASTRRCIRRNYIILRNIEPADLVENPDFTEDKPSFSDFMRQIGALS